MSQDDRIQIYEAIGYIISSMPMDQAATSLRSFAFEILAKVHAISATRSPASKDELRQIAGQ